MQLRAILLALAVCLTLNSVQAADWNNLLNGQSLDQWMKADGSAPSETWQFKDGWLHLNGKGGNLITRKEYGDFELWFEFRISEKGNSGIKYRVQKYGNSLLGIEYQILDDAAFPKLPESHKTGSMYHLVTPIPAEKRMNPPGEINVAKVRVQGNRVQHWINGQLLIDQKIGTEDWAQHVQNSKFKKHEAFGQNQLGRIMLTDHNCEVWYRNVFIKSLSSGGSGGVTCSCP